MSSFFPFCVRLGEVFAYLLDFLDMFRCHTRYSEILLSVFVVTRSYAVLKPDEQLLPDSLLDEGRDKAVAPPPPTRVQLYLFPLSKCLCLRCRSKCDGILV